MQHQHGTLAHVQIQPNIATTLFAMNETATFFLASGLVEAVTAT